MYSLIIDTSSERGLVAIASGLNIFFKEELPFGIFNSKILMTLLESLFKKFKINAQDFKVIGVGIGPGSFTGIRVGASAASGLAIGADIPLVGFCSLSGYITSEEGPFVSLIDAKLKNAYVLFQENKAGQVVELSSPQLMAIDDLPKNIPLVGPNFQRLKLENALERHPDAPHLAKLTEEKFQKKQYSKEGRLELLYLRSTVI